MKTRKLKYVVSIVPIQDQSNSHFRKVRGKPRSKTFLNEERAIDYYRLCKDASLTRQFNVEWSEFLVVE